MREKGVIEINKTPYIFEKNGEYICFDSCDSAAAYFGIKQSTLSKYYARGYRHKGYRIIKAKSEWEVYFDKRLWKAWQSMKQRCNSETNQNYKYYGGRGISVCDEWKDYIPFARWAINNGYRDDLTLDRIDNNGNYEPANCRWATKKEQQNNRRGNHIMTVDGVSHTMTEWGELCGISINTIRERLARGYSDTEALKVPLHGRIKTYREGVLT